MAEGYLDPGRVHRLAAELGLRPSKRRGQNFVTDANTIRRIVATAGVGPGDHVVEIGPGLGSLTAGLLASGASVTAVEIDASLARRLGRTMAELQPGAESRLTVVEADALAWPAGPAAGSPPPGGAERRAVSHLVANLPYNVAVPVLLRCWALLPTLGAGLVLVQQEVADRLVAPPGSRTYGVPSAKLAWDADAQPAGRVPATVFWPRPNVESGLVRLARRDPPATTAGRAHVFAVIDVAFAGRRKMLRTALRAAWPTDQVSRALAQAAIDPTARGETLGITDFARLAEGLAPTSGR